MELLKWKVEASTKIQLKAFFDQLISERHL